MTKLSDLALPPEDEPWLLLRIVAVDGLAPALRGATRAHRPAQPPRGEPFGGGLDAALVAIIASAARAHGPPRLETVPVPGHGSATVLLQWSDDLPPSVWDLLRAGCSLALHTSWRPGRVTTRAVVRSPSAVADPRACHALDLLLAGTSQVVLSNEGTSTRLIETFCAPRRLVCVGSGLLSDALADAARLTMWSYEKRDVADRDDLADLTCLDLLIVTDTGRAWDVVALALLSPVGHIGLIDPAARRLDGTALLQERLHVLDPADADCPPVEQALLVLAELMASRRDQARRTWGSLVLAE